MIRISQQRLLLVLRSWCCLVASGVLWGLPPSAPAATRWATAQNFPIPEEVAEQIWFWEAIFYNFPATSVVIHDVNLTHVIIDIIDFEAFAKRSRRKPYTPKEIEAITDRYLERYHLAVRRLRKEGKHAVNYGPMEQRVYNVYRKEKRALYRLFTEEVRLRRQVGFAGDFKIAAARSTKYLPYMEQVFIDKGLPPDLTRLVFVESMFNVHAVSKAGASGIWQFMPETASQFLILNKYIDERSSPWKATKAAAALLARNFARFKDWGLAVTAYNHGASGIARAVKQVNSKNLGKIINKYQGPSFGFASRNYYGEFLAARNVYNRYFLHRGGNRGDINVTKVKLKRGISLNQLLQATPLNRHTLEKYNQCLQPKAFHAYGNKPLPADYEIFVPIQIANQVRQALAQIPTIPAGKEANRWNH